MSPDIYVHVEEENEYDSIVAALSQFYEKKQRNNVFSKHLLVSRRQANDENVLEYLRALQLLAKDGTFVDVRAMTYHDELIRDSFINGLQTPPYGSACWSRMILIFSVLLISQTA